MTRRCAFLLLLAVSALLLAGGSLPHLHASDQFGLWNEEHDLSLMARLGSDAPPLDAVPVVALALALVLALASAAERPAGTPLRLSVPRAPPAS